MWWFVLLLQIGMEERDTFKCTVLWRSVGMTATAVLVKGTPFKFTVVGVNRDRGGVEFCTGSTGVCAKCSELCRAFESFSSSCRGCLYVFIFYVQWTYCIFSVLSPYAGLSHWCCKHYSQPCKLLHHSVAGEVLPFLFLGWFASPPTEKRAMKLVISLSSNPRGFGFLQVFPVVQSLPAWVGPGGLELLGGVLSINVLAPLFLVALTVILCQSVRESSIINDVMTVTKVDQCFPQLTSDFLHFLELGCFWRQSFVWNFIGFLKNFNGLNKRSTLQFATYVSKDVKFLHESFLWHIAVLL